MGCEWAVLVDLDNLHGSVTGRPRGLPWSLAAGGSVALPIIPSLPQNLDAAQTS